MKSSINVKTGQQGFTLIELVVVIVILGILAVTAAPKFIDLTSDAKSSVVQAVEGALNSAADMAHAKALVDGTVDGTISIAGQSITFEDTYPNATSIDLLMDIDTELSVGDFILGTSGTAATYTHAKAATAAECYAYYTPTTDKNVKPVIKSVTTDC
ncbi:prepilin-type N-terminal cleavage/methylation domain-containing protein [Colwellia psychrerythraea]|uniref:MSHA pilin protein MshA n=1 Tax=Colwellia psychrerythraea TaxID=28229 RepID=A0A099KPD1_COLPS|nr:prepilin-type N-terminal cleavage/methylation domain-containing protein [Colwellia psychrerythraea]KGJ92366.1 hypothetical protein GAB14E_0488 [Colwellia psychrerythraea]